MLILDEYNHALHLLEYGFSTRMNYQELLILAKYYRYLGESTQSVSKRLVEYCEKFVPDYNDVLHFSKIKRAVNKSKKQSLKFPQNVFITKSELDSIRKIENRKYEKILFVMLALSRNNILLDNKGKDNYYVNLKLSTIFSLAKVYARKDEKNYILNLFKINNLLRIPERTKAPNGKIDSFQLLFINEESEKILWIKDFNNIVDSYPLYCEVCGNIFEKKTNKSNNQKYCTNCFNENNKNLKLKWWHKTH